MPSAQGEPSSGLQTKEPASGAADSNGQTSSSRSQGRGKAARHDASPSVQLSKALSYILRHGAAKEGLKVRSDGYIPLQLVLARPKVSKIKMEGSESPTEADVLSIVESNDKKRFEIGRDEEEGLLIRAVQGHSLAEITALDHVPITLSNLSILASTSSEEVSANLPPGIEILHGTTSDAWDKIRSSTGLNRMKRNHIHLAKGRPGADNVISGMRKSSPIILHVDLVAAVKDGIPFFLASNGAILTNGEAETGTLPLRYISKVEEAQGGRIIWTPSMDSG